MLLIERQLEQTLLLPTHRKSLIGFRLVYLHLTLTHFKGQGQDYAHFDCISETVTDKTDCYCQYIGCRQLAFDRYVYI